MLHPELSLFREDIFGTDVPVVRLTNFESAKRRRATQRTDLSAALPALLNVHVINSSDPIKSAAEQRSVQGTCFVFVAPYLRNSDRSQLVVRHQIVAHSEDMAGAANEGGSIDHIRVENMSNHALNEKTQARDDVPDVQSNLRIRREIVSSCLSELLQCPVALTSSHQVAAFLLLRCSLTVKSFSEMAELLDFCVYSGDSATASALLSHINEEHSATKSRNLGAELPVSVIPSDRGGEEWCVAVSPPSYHTSSTTVLNHRDIAVICFSHSHEVHSLLRGISQEVSPEDRLAVIGPGGEYLVHPTSPNDLAAKNDFLSKPVQTEACWVSVSRTFTRWRKDDEIQDTGAMRAHLARYNHRVVIIVADFSATGHSNNIQFSPLKFIERNPLFYGATCHCILVGTAISSSSPPFYYKELYTLVTRMNGTFSKADTMIRTQSMVADALQMERKRLISRIHFALVPLSRTRAPSLVYSSNLPGGLELARIHGRIVKVGSIFDVQLSQCGLEHACRPAVVASAISVKFSARSNHADGYRVIAWGFSPREGRFLFTCIPFHFADQSAELVRSQGVAASRDVFTVEQTDLLLKWVRCCDSLRDSVSLSWASALLPSADIAQAYLRKLDVSSSPQWVRSSLQEIVRERDDSEITKHSSVQRLLVLLNMMSVCPFGHFSSSLAAKPSPRLPSIGSNLLNAVPKSKEGASVSVPGTPLQALGTNNLRRAADSDEDIASFDLNLLNNSVPQSQVSSIANRNTHIDPSTHQNDHVIDSADDMDDTLQVRGVTAVDPQFRSSAVYVDDRWLSLGKTIPAASSFEAAIAKSQPSGVVTQKSFSISISKFSHGVLYVSLAPCEALINVARASQIIVTRKLFLCEVFGGEITAIQTETIHNGPTWGRDDIAGESGFSNLSRTATEHAFYNLERGKTYCVIHLAAIVSEGEWLKLSDFLVADGVEFATPTSYVQDVCVDEVTPRSISLQWDGNCSGYMVTYQNIASAAAERGLVEGSALDPKSVMGEDAPVIICASGQGIQLNNLIPSSVYLIRVSPNAGKHCEAVESEEVIAATPPSITKDMVSSHAYCDPSDILKVNVRVGLVLPSFLTNKNSTNTNTAASLVDGGSDVPAITPIYIRGSGYELACTPLISMNHSETTSISLRAGGPVFVQVGFEILVVRRSNNYPVFSRRVTDLLTTRLGPFHVVANLKISQITDTSCLVSWHTSNTSGPTRLTITKQELTHQCEGTPAPSPQVSSTERGEDRFHALAAKGISTKPDGFAKGREKEVCDHRQVISVESGKFEHKVTDLHSDSVYLVLVTCEGNIADQNQEFRTAPPPPKADQLVIQHNSKLQAIYFSFPSASQLHNRLLRATVHPTLAIYNSSLDETRTAVADVAIPESRGESVFVELVQLTPSSSGHPVLESDPTHLFIVSNARLLASACAYEIRFTCGMKSSVVSVGIGSQFVVAEDGNSRALFNGSMLAAVRGVDVQMPPHQTKASMMFGALQTIAATTHAKLPPANPFRGLIQPVMFSGTDLLEEQMNMFCILPLPSPSEQLFKVKVFEEYALVSMIPSMIDSFMDDIPRSMWESGEVLVSLVFASPCMESVEVPLPLPPPPPSADADGIPLSADSDRTHTVVVPLSVNRALTATINCFFQAECCNSDTNYFLNAVPVTSAPILLSTPKVFSITSISVCEMTPFSCVLEWDSKNDLFDISILSCGVVTFSTKTTRSRLLIESLSPGTVYHVVITGNMSGAHEGHHSFVTPVDLAQISLDDLCRTIGLSNDGVLHMSIPSTSYDACVANPNVEGGGIRSTQLVVTVSDNADAGKITDSFSLVAPPKSEWVSQDSLLTTAVALFDPKLLQQQILSQQHHADSGKHGEPLNKPVSMSFSNPRLPFLSVKATSCLTEGGVRSLTATSVSKRVDILGCPRVVFSDDHQFATLYWVGSASHYCITIRGSLKSDHRSTLDAAQLVVTGGSVTKASPTLLIRCADYKGQLLTIVIKSLEHPSNILKFTVIIPDAAPVLRVMKHTLKHISVELPPPRVIYAEGGSGPAAEETFFVSKDTHTRVETLTPILSVSTAFEFEGTHYTYHGDGTRAMICSISVREPCLAPPISMQQGVYQAPVPKLQQKETMSPNGMLLKVSTRTALILNEGGTTNNDCCCLNPTIEVASNQILPPLRPLENAVVRNVTQSSADIVWQSSDDEFYCTVKSSKPSSNAAGPIAVSERTILSSVTNLKLRSLTPGTYHEVTIRGRRSGDTALRVAFFSCPGFADNSVSFRRHHDGLKCTVLLDVSTGLPLTSFRCGDRSVDIKVELLVCDADGQILESHPLGREPLTIELSNETTSLYVRKFLRATREHSTGESDEGDAIVFKGAEGAVVAIDENSIDEDGVPKEISAETRIFVCRAPRYLQLAAMELITVSPNSATLCWPSPSTGLRQSAPFVYTATVEAIESLSLVSKEHLKKQVVVVSEPEVHLGALIDATLYRAYVRVDSNFSLHTEKNSAIIIHDDAPEVPSVCRYFVTPSKKIASPPHKRYVGGATFFMDMVTQMRQSPQTGLRSFPCVRLLPDNVMYVQHLPAVSGGVPDPSSNNGASLSKPTFLTIPPSTPIENSRYAVDVPLQEPATELTHRFEFFRVMEVSKHFGDFINVLNPIQYSEADVQLIKLVRALGKPHCILSTSTRAELKWSVSNAMHLGDEMRFDVVIENLLAKSRQEVQRVAEERVLLTDLTPAMAYRVMIGPSIKDVPCEPLSIVLLTAPKKPKAPKLSTALLSVVFDIPPTQIVLANDGNNVTTSTTALVICEKEQSTKGCSTAVDFLEKSQTRNVFRSTPNTAQRIDLRLRSSKSYKFVFFSSIHHPEAINGVVHSKPTVVDFSTDCFPPQSLHLISRTKASVTIGWTTPDFGSKSIIFDVQMVPIGPVKDPSTLAAIQRAVELSGGLSSESQAATANSHNDAGLGAELVRVLGSQRNKLAVDLFSERPQHIASMRVDSLSGQPASHCTFSQLSPDVLYAFRVRQQSGELVSAWSNTLVTSPLAPPTPVTNLRVTNLTATTIALSWVPSQLPQEGERMSYLVQVRSVVPTAANSVTSALHTGGGGGFAAHPPRKTHGVSNQESFDREDVSYSTTYELTGLTANTQYRIVVTPINNYGEKCTEKNATLLVRTEAVHGWK